MHKYLLTRGVNKYVRRWIEDLESIFLPHPLKNKKGVVTQGGTQIVMRPIQLWEMIYPEEQDDTVCKLIGEDSYPQHSLMHKLKKALSKILRLKITKGKPDLTNIVHPIIRPHVGISILGNKEDMKDINGNEML